MGFKEGTKAAELRLKAIDQVAAMLEADSAPIAFQKALAALNERERVTVNLWRSGDVKTKGEALAAAGWAPSTCQNASTVFNRVKVQVALMLDEKASEPLKTVDADSFLADLVELAHADPVDALDDKTGKVRPVGEWPKPLRRMVKKIDFNVLGGVESVTFEGRASIQGMVGKHRSVKAFDQKTIERRVFVVRDYTGRVDGNGKEIGQQGPGPRIIDAEVIEQAGAIEAGAGASEGIDQGEPSSVIGRADEDAATAKPERLAIADAEDISDIDRGYIPGRG